ncbi:uncharacterized protein BDR25DRAFT_319202 [Lindgomyces ingoldianus]|uniref:Uncharacterized protein n=1 Tax=Lindgomyces ingoldianus TaxID=673940 RepID=A0ACB6QE99_9PLEO|nr:uncharacterized protein BDR25DRAFT_319202 [Lindgomyces ingoldianus]KAF2464465.1 hypothetical protein BDR25DRAFT_319202 [Lindgomyces ingoldianus]
MSRLRGFRARLAKLTAIEDNKTALIQDLINQVQSLEDGLSDAQQQLDRERRVSDMFQRSDKEKEAELRRIHQRLSQMNYVSVLIDGDCMTFIDELLRAGETGGRQAARLLKASIIEHLREKFPKVPASVKILIRVYANVKGLAKSYSEAKVISNPAEFDSFVNGFNKEDALCDFVNAGDGKECADEKIKVTFKMSIENIQCCHVVFGGSADNGYARLLGPYSDSTNVTLLEGPPFANELRELAIHLPTIYCPKVFRTTKLDTLKPSFDLTPPRTPASEKSDITNYATVASRKGQTMVPEQPLTVGKGVASITGKIARNAAGQRIDVDLNCSSADMKAMKAKKYCNEYHILGRCKYNNLRKGCLFGHGIRVKGKELEALRAAARLSACPNGVVCKDTECILGHRCLKSQCKQDRFCFFPPTMHFVDTKIMTWEA